MRSRVLCFLIAGIALWPAALPAQPVADKAGDVLIRARGPLHVDATESASTVIVIGNDAVIDGTLERQLIIINGTAKVNGSVAGIVAWNARVELGERAHVEREVLLYRSALERHTGAVIGGGVHHEHGLSFSAQAAWFFWLSITVTLVVAGLLLVFLAGRQVAEAAEQIRSAPRGTLIATACVVVGLPVAAFFTLLSGIGIVLSLAIMLFLIPALALLGLLVSGAAIGRAALGRGDRQVNGYAAAALGIFVLHVIMLVPVVGVLTALLASQVGAGALLYRVWLARVPAVEVPQQYELV
jgi:hypothetical protein